MIYATEIVRLDGLFLVASMDDQNQADVQEMKQQARQILKKLTRTSEPRASLEGKKHTMHYLLNDQLCFIAITERAYPKKLAQTYLADICREFETSYPRTAYLDPHLRPYTYAEFDRYIERSRKTYQDTRATDNLGRLNDELKDVAQVMTKNIEDLLYRGDSLEKMGDMSSRLREDSAKYKRAAVRINWERMLENWGIWAALLLFMGAMIYVWFIR
ncbi:Longin-like domain-containing protein [Neohortaea acidophila]|uniref:Protein transport protein SEC22 n=1 Tax=Neohortaea acidophila TaxID=245834 RepID=A0A6A6Q2B9_9PEZI|nr:Longin-like domain-containing protein [Neohortaea acidophila]KAF2485813.1 Longin-like domain-containing protein [Neohortaea acidophila]